jgi:serine phosphatase RsbU (regulator of sigma subunit)
VVQLWEFPTVLPPHPRLRFGRSSRPGRHPGTDYHDVLDLGGNRFAIVMADVCGPGTLPAAARFAPLLRGRAGRHDDSGSLLHCMREHVRRSSQDGAFATGLCAVIDIRRRIVRVACAGHPAPLLAREGTPVMPLPVHSTGSLGDTGVIVASEFELLSGDHLLFYTDGVTGQENGDGVQFGCARLTDALQECVDFTPAVAVDVLAHEIDAFTDGRAADDDQTLLLVEIG